MNLTDINGPSIHQTGYIVIIIIYYESKLPLAPYALLWYSSLKLAKSKMVLVQIQVVWSSLTRSSFLCCPLCRGGNGPWKLKDWTFFSLIRIKHSKKTSITIHHMRMIASSDNGPLTLVTTKELQLSLVIWYVCSRHADESPNLSEVVSRQLFTCRSHMIVLSLVCSVALRLSTYHIIF